jgi:hypothetical protein
LDEWVILRADALLRPIGIHRLNDDGDREGSSIAKWPRNGACRLYSLKKNERYGPNGVDIFVIERWHLALKRGELRRKIEKRCMTD